MKKILIVLDHAKRFLQNKHRFDSLNVNVLEDLLKQKGYEVEITTYNQILNTSTKVENSIVIYTASQMDQYKNYIENTIYFLQNNNYIVPNYEILKSHENKFFQELVNQKKKIPTNIKSYLFGDISEYKQFSKTGVLDYPHVIKGINGSASMNVTIANSNEEALEAIQNINKNMILGMNQDMPLKYDLFPKENLNNRQFIVQEYIDLPNYDYRVHVMGDKYWGHKRTIKEKGELTSGSDSINDYEVEIPKDVLDYAQELFNKINTPHVIFDIVHTKGKLYLIEWSGIHLGCISLLHGKRYYKKEQTKWTKYEEVPILEQEYVNAWDWYIKNKLGEI